MTASPKKLKAILVEGVFYRRKEDHLAELSELAYVAGYEVVDRITQNLSMPNPEYFLGKGKAKQIKGRIKELNADIVILENSLDVVQYTNLKQMWHKPIIDRFELILEIFTKHAGSKEALTQIRLAALKKHSPSRHEAHSSVTSRNALIKKLEDKLEKIKKSKELRRKRRLKSGFDLIAIAGYTNAGKSTLMNALTPANTEVSGKMFTTLNTKTRDFDIKGRKLLITDTVGFISRLPHELINAFYATLAEIRDADLILLVIDGNDSIENIKRKVLASQNTLIAINAEDVPILPVLNKIDVAQKIPEKKKIIEAALDEKPIKISAFTGENLECLKKRILGILDTFQFKITIPNTDKGLSLLSQLHDKTRIINELYSGKTINIVFETNERMARYFYNSLQAQNFDVKIINKNMLKEKLGKKEESEEDEISTIKTSS
ncbi:MAG: GTPase HflX [Asgard group archaeon]|nr:GTPase HflX [Asgard group archaeon]